MKNIISKTVAYTTVMTLVFSVLFSSFEPIYLKAQTSATDTVMVTLNVDAGITITSPADVTMTPNMGIVATSSTGAIVWNVKTNAASGYSLAVKATSTPALQTATTSHSFADYQTGAPTVWAPPASSAQFGYSAYGTHVNTGTWGTGGACGAAVPIGTMRYKGFTTTDQVVATSTATTTTAGVDTNVCVAASQNGVYAASGIYRAYIVATATVQ